jgi:Uncharacterized conserved protein
MNTIELLDIPRTTTENSSRDRMVALVRRWGGSASDAVLDHTCSAFVVPGIEGFIGYRVENKCAVVYGDPLCALEDRERVVQAFHEFCEGRGYHVIYVMASENFAGWSAGRFCHARVEFGEELVCDPVVDIEGKGSQGRLVRKKVRRAINEGLAAKEYCGGDGALERRIEEVGELWLKGRSGLQIFVAHVGIFQDRMGKRWFYAEHEGRIVGVLTLDRVERNNGWFLSHMMILSDAPVGAPEILVVHVMEALKAEGCRYLALGVVPGEELGDIVGLSNFTKSIARAIFRVCRKCFLLDGKKQFWGKFQPRKERSFILFSEPHIGLKSLLAMARAFNVS